MQPTASNYSAYPFGSASFYEGLPLDDSQKLEMEMESYCSTLPPIPSKLNFHYDCINTNKNPVSSISLVKEFEIITLGNTLSIKNKKKQTSIYLEEKHQKDISSIYVQGERIFSASEDATLKVWDINSGKCLKTFTGHADEVYSLCIEGNLLFSGSWDKTIKIWDIESGRCLKTLFNEGEHVLSVAVYGRYLFTGSSDETIRVWDITNGECVRRLRRHEDWVYALLIHNGLIFSGSRDKTIKIWDLGTGICLNTLKGHKVGIRNLRIEEGNLISTSILDAESKTWAMNLPQ